MPRGCRCPDDSPTVELYHPTFLYESVWNLGVFVLLIWAERRFRLGHGRLFALYVAAYTAGRGWVELLRVDPANHILGLRLNAWTALVVFTAATAFLLVRRSGDLAGVSVAAGGRASDGDGTDGAAAGDRPAVAG